MKYISVEEAKQILCGFAMASAINNLGHQCDASAVFEDCAARLETWIDTIPCVEIKTANVLRSVNNEILLHAGNDYEELVKSDLSHSLGEFIFREKLVSIEKRENNIMNSTDYIASVRLAINDSKVVKK